MDVSKISDEVCKRLTKDKQPTPSPMLIILVGLQYAGKSFIATKVEERNFIHFWATKIKEKYGLDNDQMIEVACLVLESLLPKKFNIIIDFVNHKKEIRQLFQMKAQEHGADYNVIFVDTPKEERLRRHEENKRLGDKPGRRVISLQQIQEFEDIFEAPSMDENTITIKDEDDMDEFIRYIDNVSHTVS